MTDPFHVLVVDDDAAMRDSLRHLLTRGGWRVDTAARAQDAVARLHGLAPDVVLCDLKMPGMSGLDFVRAVAGPHCPPILMLSAHGDISTAVEAVQAGARGFLEKPHDPPKLIEALRSAAQDRRQAEQQMRIAARVAQGTDLDRVAAGHSAAAAQLRIAILDAAGSLAPVLIEGAVGTGRSAIARVVHDLSPRAGTPFVARAAGLNPGPIPTGGTLFLEGLDRCDDATQAQLALALPDGPRLIAALDEDRADRVMPDLRWRLATHVIRVPALRERPDDIAELFLAELDPAATRMQIDMPTLSADDLALLIAHSWPGNLRELRAVAERFAMRARHGTARIGHCLMSDEDRPPVPPTLREAVAAFERKLIARALTDHEGRMEDAADGLGIGRRTLNEKIVKLGIDKEALLRTGR